MQTVQVQVTKNGTICFNRGDIRLSQDRNIWIINKTVKPEEVVGHFSVKLPDNFDLYGGNAESRKVVAAILKKGKEVAGLNKKGKGIGKFGAQKRPKFTKRHFIDTANMIKEMPEPMRTKWAEQKAKEYAAGNPQFDRTKFMKACGV